MPIYKKCPTFPILIFVINRQSRLLPNPISKEKDHRDSSTFMTMYVRAMPRPKVLNNQAEPCVPLPDDATSIDRYYADRNIAYGFYYTVLDLPAMEKLAGLVAVDRSVEVGPTLELFQEEQGPPDDSKATIIIKRWMPISSSRDDARREFEIERRDLQLETETRPASRLVKPGEDGWRWLDLPQSPILLESLATLWENVEEAYVENLKQALYLKRIHTSAVVPYADLVLTSLMKFVDRPDKRQDLLHDFHRAFNEIDEDLRDDLDMKCELHCRVSNFKEFQIEIT